MKNTIFVLIFVLTLGTLVSCSKKEEITTHSMLFSLSQFAPKNFLATAD
ncbi:hypothetical protein [Mucilaginibacter antarcticus]|uniref:Uncharacterized protein n=1 Tax=Mucilaginibacter antarcticus TaxID=1855725 RepID=A0ABW5XNF8_9SPHI